MDLQNVTHSRKTAGLICVYKISCSGTKRFYIGSTNDFERRAYEHLKQLKAGSHHSPKLQNVFNKHGLKTITIKIVRTFSDINSATEFETESIRFYGLRNLLNCKDSEGQTRRSLKPVYGYTANGSVVKFDSSVAASDSVGTTRNNITRAIRNRISCKGMHWSYSPSSSIDEIKSKTDCVFAFSRDGVLVHSFKSQADASMVLGCSPAQISSAIKGVRSTRTAGGYFWSKSKTPPNTVIAKCKPVRQISDSGEVVWRSAKEASVATGIGYKSISAAANGKIKKSGGSRWEFVRI